jgi:hypothetical protein
MSDDTLSMKAQSVMQTYENDLLNKPNVQGVGVGLVKRYGEYTGEVGIVVMVSQKVPVSQLAPEEIIPKEIDGVLVDIQEMGSFHVH